MNSAYCWRILKHPGEPFLVVEFSCASGVPIETRVRREAATLEEARRVVRQLWEGRVPDPEAFVAVSPRTPFDGPAVVETWQ